MSKHAKIFQSFVSVYKMANKVLLYIVLEWLVTSCFLSFVLPLTLIIVYLLNVCVCMLQFSPSTMN